MLIDRPLHVRCGKADGTRCVLESDNVDQSTGACAGGPTTGAVSLHKAFYATIYHTGWAILEGFEFRCFATGGTEYGAAVDINTGKVILRDNLFRQNAGPTGGPLVIRLFAEAFVDSCVFDGNTATNSGGI